MIFYFYLYFLAGYVCVTSIYTSKSSSGWVLDLNKVLLNDIIYNEINNYENIEILSIENSNSNNFLDGFKEIIELSIDFLNKIEKKYNKKYKKLLMKTYRMQKHSHKILKNILKKIKITKFDREKHLEKMSNLLNSIFSKKISLFEIRIENFLDDIKESKKCFCDHLNDEIYIDRENFEDIENSLIEYLVEIRTNSKKDYLETKKCSKELNTQIDNILTSLMEI